MSRMESPREQSTVTVRVPEELKDEYKAAVDSMSEDLREHITDVATGGDDGAGPDDDKLCTAWEALKELRNPRTYKVDVDMAESSIAQRTQIPGKAVRSRVLKPLEHEGWISAKWGSIQVHDRPQ